MKIKRGRAQPLVERSGRVDRRRKRVEERGKKRRERPLRDGRGGTKGLNRSNELTTRDFWGESGFGGGVG